MSQMVRPLSESLVRRLSVTGLWLLIINGMIGAAIFGAPAEAARLAGAFSPWLFLVCGVLIAPIILCFARLSSHFSGTGGPVLYATEAFGPFAGFQVGWCLYIARLTAFAANSNLLVTTLGDFSVAARTAILFAICAALTLLNLLGTRGAIRWLGVITTLKFAPLLMLVAAGLIRLDLAPTLAPPHFDRDFGAAILLVLYAYVGFENGLVAAGEAKNPQRDIPRALIAALLICALLYGILQLICLEAGGGSLVQVSGKLLGPVGASVMTAGVIASVGGHLSGVMFAVPRITYRLGLDGQLPKWFAFVHPSRKTPAASILFLGAAGFLLAASGSFVWLAGLSVLTRVPVWICSILALYRLKRRLDVVALSICLALLTQVSALAYVNGAALVAAGSLLYWAARRSAKPHSDQPPPAAA